MLHSSTLNIDDAVLVGNENQKMQSIKDELDNKFSIKDLGKLKYIIGIDFTCTPEGLVLNQYKNILNILEDCGLQGCKPSSLPIKQNLKLDKGEKEPRVDVG